jgi:predicted esterase
LFKVFDRDVWVYYPAKASKFANKRLPAVIVLHGSGDFPGGIANTTRFEDLAESAPETFLAVFPEMSIPGGDMWGYDNDLDFFRAVVEMLGREFIVKRDAVYVCGHSAGGSMAMYLQNNLPDVFHGAASVEAGVGHQQFWNASSFGRPTMVVWNHNDPVLEKFGGDALLEDTITTLRRHDSTRSGPSFITDVPVLNHSVVKRAKKISWGSVGPSPPTELISWESTIPTHHWSSPWNIPGSFDATVLVWDFFRATSTFHSPRDHIEVPLDMA